MVLYTVTWFIRPELTKGKGRVRNNESFFAIQVLCRSARDALSCLDFHYHRVFEHRDKFSLDDGEVTLKRSVIDSRGFHPHYLMLENMAEPINLIDVKSNLPISKPTPSDVTLFPFASVITQRNFAFVILGALSLVTGTVNVAVSLPNHFAVPALISLVLGSGIFSHLPLSVVSVLYSH